MKRFMYVSLLSLLLSCTSQAGQWYAGASAGYIEHEYAPTYIHINGAADSTYENVGRGTELGVHGGYMQELNSLLSVGCQARVSVNDSEWTMKFSEPASFRYEQPYTWGLAVVPVVNLSKKIAVIFEAGLIQGVVEEKKSGSQRSVYDASETVGGTTIGMGMRYSISDSIDVTVQFRHAEFDNMVYKTHTPAGAIEEVVMDDPVAESWSLGVSYRF